MRFQIGFIKLLLALLCLSSCAGYRSTRPPKTLSEAQHRAAQRAARRYYNPMRCARILGYDQLPR
ncbi:hypothetical protein Q5H92_21915 [Hymenobacter sp. M29]|uniref:Lipoprotein n=1 Tax=Hymenobacter mellowenesis TaxID=3063995 RepID=A0ABT9AJV5_9BACT|nr:hypothetical protein [Hymenobacter sp. M29]MDO7849037.1 hypothetical protein [Hymenobacter sp. M29]